MLHKLRLLVLGLLLTVSSCTALETWLDAPAGQSPVTVSVTDPQTGAVTVLGDPEAPAPEGGDLSLPDGTVVQVVTPASVVETRGDLVAKDVGLVASLAFGPAVGGLVAQGLGVLIGSRRKKQPEVVSQA